MKFIATCLLRTRRKISSRLYFDGETALRYFITIFEFVDSIWPEPKVTIYIRQNPDNIELF